MIGCVVMGFASAVVLGFIALLTVMLLDPERGGPGDPSKAIRMGTRIILFGALPITGLLLYASKSTSSEVASFTDIGLALGVVLLFASAAAAELSYRSQDKQTSPLA